MSSAASSLRTVATGLGLAYAGLCLSVLAVLTPILGGMFVGPRNMDSLVLVAALLVAVGAVLDVIGRLLCLAMPSDASGTRVLIFVSVAFSLLAFAISLLHLGNKLFGLGVLEQLMENLAIPTSLVGTVLFVLFLRGLALYVRRPRLAGLAVAALIAGGVEVVAYFGMVGLILTTGLLGLALLGWGVLAVGLGLIILYGNLLTYLRQAVREYAERRSQDEDYPIAVDEGVRPLPPASPGDTGIRPS